jgi:beta-glucosidase
MKQLHFLIACILAFQFGMASAQQSVANFTNINIEKQIDSLLLKMSLPEKIGQMYESNYSDENAVQVKQQIREGKIGALLAPMDFIKNTELQRIAVEESPHHIPLLFGADIIHGLRTVLPIPLAQAASWNTELVQQAARIAAEETSSFGVNWNYSPMVDIARDPRWGRIAEGFGEDPYLASIMGVAMVKGYQSDDLTAPTSIASCGKHFVGYGAAEGGRDYNTTYIPENELRNTYLKPFMSIAQAGVCSYMSAFNDLNGLPATANAFTLHQILRDEWQFNGFVVSDQHSVMGLITHGFAADSAEAANKAINAGLNMEMGSTSFLTFAMKLIKEGKISEKQIDESVRYILRIKFRLGLFEKPYKGKDCKITLLSNENKAIAQKLAEQSIVMLKNQNDLLPLSPTLKSIAIIGPYGNNPGEMDGCWTSYGRIEDVQAVLPAIQKLLAGNVTINYAKGVDNCTSLDTSLFSEAIEAARKSDIVLFFGGEHSEQTGENNSRAFLRLPGVQEDLINALAKTGTPIVLTVFSGRPLILENILPKVNSVLYAWHTGIMGGPALANIIFGKTSPTGKLPVTFPKAEGQIPLYYNHKPSNQAPVHNLGNFANYSTTYKDFSSSPAFPFGYGLSYAKFEYSDLVVFPQTITATDSLHISVTITNNGKHDGIEVVQLYLRDKVASITRPVKELKDFKRVLLKPGESKPVEFTLSYDDFAFYNIKNQLVVESGTFNLWIGTNSAEGLTAEFEIK